MNDEEKLTLVELPRSLKEILKAKAEAEGRKLRSVTQEIVEAELGRRGLLPKQPVS